MAYSLTHEKIVPKRGGFSMSRVDDKYLQLLRARYRAASKKEKGVILDEFVKTTGYGRKYAIALLNGKRDYVKEVIRRPRSTLYGAGLIPPLLVLTDLFDGICSKRLRAAMDVELPGLCESGFLQVSPGVYEKLMQISPASMDRLLVGRRSQLRKSRGFTKPGTLLKHQIPIRTWADWTEDKPGFCEMDLVDHSGGVIIRGADHAWTLCFTDVKTTWTECVATRNKAQVHVFDAICRARQRLPFPLLGIDSDNGSEFINDQLYRYCLREEITFTRGRAGKKNDSAYAEQKNWSVVRRAQGEDTHWQQGQESLRRPPDTIREGVEQYGCFRRAEGPTSRNLRPARPGATSSADRRFAELAVQLRIDAVSRLFEPCAPLSL
jgi:hypothetical protein